MSFSVMEKMKNYDSSHSPEQRQMLFYLYRENFKNEAMLSFFLPSSFWVMQGHRVKLLAKVRNFGLKYGQLQCIESHFFLWCKAFFFFTKMRNASLPPPARCNFSCVLSVSHYKQSVLNLSSKWVTSFLLQDCYRSFEQLKGNCRFANSCGCWKCNTEYEWSNWRTRGTKGKSYEYGLCFTELCCHLYGTRKPIYGWIVLKLWPVT